MPFGGVRAALPDAATPATASRRATRTTRLAMLVQYTVRLVAIGLAAGLFSAFFGVGGGIVVVPLLIMAVGLPERVATATSLLAIAITASAGVIVFAFRGEVDPGYAALVGLPATVGVLAGTAWQQRVRTSTLTYGFAVLLCAIGIWLVAS